MERGPGGEEWASALPTTMGETRSMKITDLKCAVIGRNPIVRIVTDEGISGYGEIESYKPYLKPQVLMYSQYILGEDPTNVERVMLKIRHRGRLQAVGERRERD